MPRGATRGRRGLLDLAALTVEDYAVLAALDDSKKLTRRVREKLYDGILRRARQVVVVSCSPATMTESGCTAATSRCSAGRRRPCGPARPSCSSTASPCPAAPAERRQVIGGDGLSAAIAAASVIAKVTRDRVMSRLHDSYPQYGFDRHVGYATAAHRDAIMEHGVCVLHRLSFASVAYRQLGLGGDFR